jgi:hypothetical protein
VVKTTPAVRATVRSSIVPLVIGNRTYQMVSDPRCPVCMHPGRGQIEEKILLGEGYQSIAGWASGHEAENVEGYLVDWPTLTAAQISKHFNADHCPIDAKVLHELQKQRVGEIDYTKLAGRVVDGLVLADLTVARTHERAVRGEIEPTYREGLAAAKLQADIELAAQQGDREDRSWYYEQAFEIYFTEARKHMTDEQWEHFSVAIMTNPILRQLTERAQQSGDIVDAEVLEEQQA